MNEFSSAMGASLSMVVTVALLVSGSASAEPPAMTLSSTATPGADGR